MPRSFLALVLVTAIPVIVGCAGKPTGSKIPETAAAALEKAVQFELLAIDPKHQDEKPKDDFHGWRILGRTTIKDANTRKKLVAALKQGAAENDGIFANCFNPRHGIRVTHEGKTIDFLICFECLQVQVYTDKLRDGGFLTISSPQPLFDEVLRQAGVSVTEEDKK
jgi:hypothetical protein